MAVEMTEKIKVTEQDAGQRLDAFLAAVVEGLTRSAVQRLIEQEQVLLDGKLPKPSHKVSAGEEIALTVPPPQPAAAVAEALPLEILYEDSDVIVVNKAAGMTVHPGAGVNSGTLVNALLSHCEDLSGVGGEVRPGIVHRIDKDTTGILVAAKNDAAHEGLARQFRVHSVKRVYLALAFGSPRTDKGRIEGLIGRHPVDRKRMSGKARHGRQAVTHWKVVARYPEVTLLKLKLETGRTHQIRVHLSESGHPLLGDATYGGDARLGNLKDQKLKSLIKGLGRQALHAMTLGFIHPRNGSYLEFTAALPEDMQRIIDYLDSDSGQVS
jgi:23S rRNA pseudouridine1911/1915/1917 synthase